MEPITSQNLTNYTASIPQNNQIQDYQDYSSIPTVYEPEIEQKKSASSNMLGMTALGILAIAGLGYGIAKNKKVSGLKQEIAQLSAEKDAALKLKDEAVKLKESADKSLAEYRDAGPIKRFIRRFYPNYKLPKEEIDAKKAARKAKAEAKKAEKEAAKEAKKAGKTEAKPENSEKTENK